MQVAAKAFAQADGRRSPDECVPRLQVALLRDSGLNMATGQARRNFIVDADSVGAFQKLAAGIENERVTAVENGQRRKGLERGVKPFEADSVLQKDIAGDCCEGSGCAVQFLPHAGEH